MTSTECVTRALKKKISLSQSLRSISPRTWCPTCTWTTTSRCLGHTTDEPLASSLSSSSSFSVSPNWPSLSWTHSLCFIFSTFGGNERLISQVANYLPTFKTSSIKLWRRSTRCWVTQLLRVAAIWPIDSRRESSKSCRRPSAEDCEPRKAHMIDTYFKIKVHLLSLKT